MAKKKALDIDELIKEAKKALLEDVKQQFLSKGVTHLHYMAPFSTMVLVAANGIISFNQRRKLTLAPKMKRILKKLDLETIADPNVQFRRDRLAVFNRNLHDYVPLYVGIHTPMQYVVTKDYFATQAHTIVFAEVSVEKVFDIENVCYSDGNAASSDTDFYTTSAGIDYIDWGIVLYESRNYSREYKRLKSAEVLVPDLVPPDCIDKYVFMNKDVADQFCETINPLIEQGLIEYTDFEVCFDPSYFYSMRGGKLDPNG